MTSDTALLLAGSFAAAAATTVLVTPLVAKLAVRFGVVDSPGGRRVHHGEIPRLGGVAVLLGLLLGSLAYAVFFGWDALVGLASRHELAAFLLPCLIVWAIGLVDDVRGLSPAPRVAAVAIAATIVMQAGYVVDSVATPWGPLELGYAAFPLTLLWFVGVTNAFNLIDGLDGLLTMVGISALLGCAAVGIIAGMSGTPMLAVALAGALAGFLYWNWHPAKIFLGDSGSLLVGFTTAALALKVSKNLAGATSAHIPLALCAFPIAETFLTLARRHVSGHPYLVGDRSHIHHVMLNRGLGVRRAVLTLAGVSAVLSLAAVLSRYWRSTGALITVLLLLSTAAISLRYLGYVEFKVLWQRFRRDLFRRRQRGIPEVLAVIRAGELLGEVATLAELQRQLQEAAREAGLAFLAVEPSESNPLPPLASCEPKNLAARRYLESRDGASTWLFSVTTSDPTAELCDEHTLRLPLPPGSGHLGHLICHRYVPEGSRVPYTTDVRQYLAEPLGRALLDLEQLRGSPLSRSPE